MNTTSSVQSARHSATDAAPPYARVPLPRGFRMEANTMTYDELLATYAETAGPVRLGRWECTDAHRPGRRLGPQASNFRATIAIGDRISTSTAAASGPIGALTAMLYDRGVAVEVVEFHQIASEEGVATYVLGTNGRRDEWGASVAADATHSALHALVACANRLW